MDVTVFDTNLIADIVKKILQNFEKWFAKHAIGKTCYNHVDVTLLNKGRMNYTIQVTNYGQFTNDILHFSREIFNDFISMGIFLNNSLIATLYSRTEYSTIQSIVGLRFVRKRLSLDTNIRDKSNIDFSHQKKYLSFQLKQELILRDLEEFTKMILNEIIVLQRLNPYTKFTYHSNEKVVYNNHIPLDNDYKSCEILATALTNIMKHSLNIDFKETCFTMLKVENSHQVEAAFMTKLLPLIHENYTFSDDS